MKHIIIIIIEHVVILSEGSLDLFEVPQARTSGFFRFEPDKELFIVFAVDNEEQLGSLKESVSPTTMKPTKYELCRNRLSNHYSQECADRHGDHHCREM